MGEYPHGPTLTGLHGGHAFIVSNVEDTCVAGDEGPDSEKQILARLGIARPWIARFARQAEINGTTIEVELLASGLVTEEAWYGALARMLALPFLAAIDPALVTDVPELDSQLNRPEMVRLAYPHEQPQHAIVPEISRLDELLDAINLMPSLGHTLIVTTPSAIRKAVWQVGQERRAREAANRLFESCPHFSARIVFEGQQGFYAGLLLAAMVAALALEPHITLLMLHIGFSSLYMATLALRFRALFHRRRNRLPVAANTPAGIDFPVYTVLVALYREEAVCEQLVGALSRLSWPRSRLDIKLVCEADDRPTIEKLRSLLPGPHFEIVEVPFTGGPRTKPRALSYALAAARGEYVAIYDAEDRPHPDQLREACARFHSLPDDVACLQAPLVITNARDSWISTLFSLEYSALFRGLLPMLAHRRLPLPLGGTSNHFRLDALRNAGGWDPYNVTEDADIGMRLYRLGYRADVISRQTLEDAPSTVSVWLHQRTRWFKGWLQTWLIMTRAPVKTAREMGWPAYTVFHIMIGGMLLSSLGHPLIFATAGMTIAAMMTTPVTDIPVLTLALFVIDSINILCSYAIFLLLGTLPMVKHEKKQLGWRWMAVPFYWLLLSLAAWRAIIELRYKPFHWNKTPHKPVVKSR